MNKLKKLSSSKQNQTKNVFEFIWKHPSSKRNYQTKKEVEWEIKDYNRKSGGHFQKYIRNYFDGKKENEVNFLDVGCGAGFTFNNHFKNYIPKINYVGIDIHNDLKNTYKNMHKNFKIYNKKPILKKVSMNKIPNKRLFRNIDFAFGEGSLHHSKSVETAIQNVSNTLKRNGIFIFWIIGEQNTLRACTDNFFRSFCRKRKNLRKIWEEMNQISKLSISIGKTLGNKKINIRKKISSLDIDPGKYKLQTLLYDYIIKFYYNPECRLSKHTQQHFDWFVPSFYHQTNSVVLKKILKKNNFKIQKFVEKTNGPFVICKKI